MGLSLTYSSLVTMLENWVESLDAEFIIELNNIIKLAEDVLVKDLDLEIFNTTATGTFNSGDSTITKPTDLLVVRTLLFVSSSNRIFLEPRQVDYLQSYWPNIATTGVPKYFAELSETQWLIAPTANGTYTYTTRYTKRPTSLVTTATTTWLSTYAGEALFLACMMCAEKYMKEDTSEAGRISMFQSDYTKALMATREETKHMRQHDYKLGTTSLPAQQ